MDMRILSEPQCSSVFSEYNNSSCPKFVLRNEDDGAGKATGPMPGPSWHLTNDGKDAGAAGGADALG